jgi:hypothetical protein
MHADTDTGSFLPETGIKFSEPQGNKKAAKGVEYQMRQMDNPGLLPRHFNH